MKRAAFVLKVKEDMLEEYKVHHEAVWPELLEALRRKGWHNYSLFMREDGTLFGYVETDEGLDAALQGMVQEEINIRWQQMMSPYFEALGSKHPDESMLELTEVFHMD